MLAKLSRKLPEGDDWLFEPKWDGFRCIVFRDGDEVVLMSRNERPFNRYFPELVEPLRAALPEHCVVDGEIVLPDADGNGLDFDALQQRIHPAASRVNMLAEQTPTKFVAFDFLALGDRNLLDTPLRERHALLEQHLERSSDVYLTPSTTDRAVAEQWFSMFEGAGLDGIIAKGLDHPYTPDKRTLVKVKHQRTADCAVAGFRIHKDGQGVGSLLLGLFDDQGEMHSVGVAAAFTAKYRAELLAELEPLTHDALDGHPWRGWAEMQDDPDAKPGGGSRWNAGKDLSWVPIRMGRVAEVTFGQLENGRFRHGVKFLNWRPDRTPQSCRYDQLDVASPVAFDDFIDATD